MLVPPSPESELEFDLFTVKVKFLHVTAKSIHCNPVLDTRFSPSLPFADDKSGKVLADIAYCPSSGSRSSRSTRFEALTRWT